MIGKKISDATVTSEYGMLPESLKIIEIQGKADLNNIMSSSDVLPTQLDKILDLLHQGKFAVKDNLRIICKTLSSNIILEEMWKYTSLVYNIQLIPKIENHNFWDQFTDDVQFKLVARYWISKLTLLMKDIEQQFLNTFHYGMDMVSCVFDTQEQRSRVSNSFVVLSYIANLARLPFGIERETLGVTFMKHYGNIVSGFKSLSGWKNSKLYDIVSLDKSFQEFTNFNWLIEMLKNFHKTRYMSLFSGRLEITSHTITNTMLEMLKEWNNDDMGFGSTGFTDVTLEKKFEEAAQTDEFVKESYTFYKDTVTNISNNVWINKEKSFDVDFAASFMTKIYYQEELSADDFIKIDEISKQRTSYSFTTLIGMIVMANDTVIDTLDLYEKGLTSRIGGDPKKIEKLQNEIRTTRITIETWEKKLREWYSDFEIEETATDPTLARLSIKLTQAQTDYDQIFEMHFKTLVSLKDFQTYINVTKAIIENELKLTKLKEELEGDQTKEKFRTIRIIFNDIQKIEEKLTSAKYSLDKELLYNFKISMYDDEWKNFYKWFKNEGQLLTINEMRTHFKDRMGIEIEKYPLLFELTEQLVTLEKQKLLLDNELEDRTNSRKSRYTLWGWCGAIIFGIIGFAIMYMLISKIFPEFWNIFSLAYQPPIRTAPPLSDAEMQTTMDRVIQFVGNKLYRAGQMSTSWLSFPLTMMDFSLGNIIYSFSQKEFAMVGFIVLFWYLGYNVFKNFAMCCGSIGFHSGRVIAARREGDDTIPVIKEGMLAITSTFATSSTSIAIAGASLATQVAAQQTDITGSLIGLVPAIGAAYLGGNPLLALPGISKVMQITSGKSPVLDQQIQKYLLNSSNEKNDPMAIEDRKYSKDEVLDLFKEYTKMVDQDPRTMQRIVNQRGYAMSEASRFNNNNALLPSEQNVYGNRLNSNNPQPQIRLLKQKEEEEEEEKKIYVKKIPKPSDLY